MNYAEKIRRRLNPNSSEPINAAIYARVSTDNEGQKESCGNQVAMARNYIANHPNIRVVGVYVDDGISGKNDFTRPQYNEMLQQIVSGNVDLVITKALSRLNRDQLNSLHLNNLLLENDATVLTLEDNQVHDFEDMNSDLLHSIKYAMDAQFVKQQSINGKKTQELRCERKELSAKDCSYGYDWHRDNKSITVNENQAEVVRGIFEEYVYRNGTPASIQRSLQDRGISICGRTVSNIIRDERYIGKFYINKRSSKLGMGKTKSKRYWLPKEQWVLVERPDLQIVDTDLFELAQRVHQTRITIHAKSHDKAAARARFLGFHTYAGKVFCSVCGKAYQFGHADRKKTIPVYRIKNHSECISTVNRILETDLEEITRCVLRATIRNHAEICTTLERILAECVKESRNNGDEIERLKKQKSAKEKQLDGLIDVLSEGGLTKIAKENIKEKINRITDEINELTSAIENEETSRLDDSYVSSKIASIRTAIAELKEFKEIDRDRILIYIERIELRPNGDVDVILKSGHVIEVDVSKAKTTSNGGDVGNLGIQDVRY